MNKLYEECIDEAALRSKERQATKYAMTWLAGTIIEKIIDTVVSCTITTFIFYFVSKGLLSTPLSFNEIGFYVLFFDFVLNFHVKK